jgi:hypothetical protein
MKQFLSILIFLLAFTVKSQELNCQVSIITEAKLEVTSIEQEALAQLKLTVTDLMNNTQWTKDIFKIEERINCNLQLQINKIPSAGVFSGSIQIQSSRPAFNTNYNTLILNYQDDDMTFSFSRNAMLIYAPNQFRDNLSSILAFYAYFIIGMDYDSFSLKGGTPYFIEAQQIVTNAQNSGAIGWKSNEQGKRNRYWLVDNMLQAVYEPLRECNYNYHRNGIDKLQEDKIKGRKAMYDALVRLTPVAQSRPNSLNILTFLNAKTTEIKNLLFDSELKEKNEFVNLLKKLDPANTSKYLEILN